MGARRVLTLVTVASLVGIAASACFADLPAASECPAAPQTPDDECARKIQAAAAANILVLNAQVPVAIQRCILGDGASCATAPGCAVRACPSTSASCFPRSECPPAVTRTIAGASCPKLLAPVPTDFACGCEECLSVCDGTGPTFSVVLPPGAAPTSLVQFPLAGMGLPTGKRLGLYMRLRGLGAYSLVIAEQQGTGLGLLAGKSETRLDFQGADVGAPFEDFIITPSALLTSPDSLTIAIVATADPTKTSVVMLQVDCATAVVVP